MSTLHGPEKRVKFDFEIDFSNGGGMQGQGFRLDIAGDDISDEALAAYVVEDMRLLMVGAVRILNREIIVEPHRRPAVAGRPSGCRVLVDLSHAVEHGMVTYPGLPAPVIGDYLTREQSRGRYAEGTEFHIGKIEMVANTGTYVDSPFHRYAGGQDIAELELRTLADLDTVVVRAPATTGRAIGRVRVAGYHVQGKAVLLHTGWDVHWGTERYFGGHPYLTGDAAAYLAESGAALVGIDSLNIDDTADGRRPAHSILLGAAIPVAEHLCGLEQLPDHGARFFAVPVKVRGLGTFPVRAFAIFAR